MAILDNQPLMNSLEMSPGRRIPKRKKKRNLIETKPATTEKSTTRRLIAEANFNYMFKQAVELQLADNWVMSNSTTRRQTLDGISNVGLFRVEEVILSATEGSFTGDNGNNIDAGVVSSERNPILNVNEANRILKFTNDPENVLTGQYIKAKGGTDVTLAIYNEAGQVIESGPESSAKVGIILLKAGEDNSENSSSDAEDFDNRILDGSDKKRPRFSETYYVKLKGGRGDLSNAKLAHGRDWTKNYKCQLGARVVDNLSGIKVQRALSEPFVVSDSRGQYYQKKYPPTLSDKVWRLEEIGRDGKPCERLERNHVSTVGDFLFLLTVDPLKLRKEILKAGDKVWKDIENHARSCIIDDTRIRKYTDSSEPNVSVVFDVVGNLKALIRDGQYVQHDHLSQYEKDRANKLLYSAFEHRDRITLYSDEMTLMQQHVTCQANSNASSLKTFIQQGSVPVVCNSAIGTSQQAHTIEFGAPVVNQQQYTVGGNLARPCINYYTMYIDSSEQNMAVVSDVDGNLKLIRYQDVQLESLPEDVQGRARKLQRFAFENQNAMLTWFNAEMSQMQQQQQVTFLQASSSNPSLCPSIQLGSVPALDFYPTINTSQQGQNLQVGPPFLHQPMPVGLLNPEDGNRSLPNYPAAQNYSELPNLPYSSDINSCLVVGSGAGTSEPPVLADFNPVEVNQENQNPNLGGDFFKSMPMFSHMSDPLFSPDINSLHAGDFAGFFQSMDGFSANGSFCANTESGFADEPMVDEANIIQANSHHCDIPVQSSHPT